MILYDFDVKEAESSKEGNEWLGPALKGLKRSSPTALKIALRSVRIFKHEFF
jgi:3-hydroxyisobutyryl-CoA hydrolase